MKTLLATENRNPILRRRCQIEGSTDIHRVEGVSYYNSHIIKEGIRDVYVKVTKESGVVCRMLSMVDRAPKRVGVAVKHRQLLYLISTASRSLLLFRHA